MRDVDAIGPPLFHGPQPYAELLRRIVLAFGIRVRVRVRVKVRGRVRVRG